MPQFGLFVKGLICAAGRGFAVFYFNFVFQTLLSGRGKVSEGSWNRVCFLRRGGSPADFVLKPQFCLKLARI
jgi:hypothetical protein